MASSSAACVFGVARLISSARRISVKIGPGRNSNSWVFMSRIDVPVMSLGMRSGVNWTLANFNPSRLATIRTRVVFPTPGTSSIRTWESVRMPTRTRRSASLTPNSRVPTRSSSASKNSRADCGPATSTA